MSWAYSAQHNAAQVNAGQHPASSSDSILKMEHQQVINQKKKNNNLDNPATYAVDPDPLYDTLTNPQEPPDGLTKVQDENVHVFLGKLKN